MPTYFKEKEPPIISYTYTKTIASKISNFSSTLASLDYHQFHNNSSQCECNTSRHLYQPYGHVITGNLSIIPNSKLRDLIAKGPVLQNADEKACLSDLHNKYVFVPANKAPNNIIIICKRYYIKTLIKELGLDNCFTPTGNSTYTSCQMSLGDIVNTHDTFMKSLGIELSDDDKRLPYLYWTPKLHKSPVKRHFIAGSS